MLEQLTNSTSNMLQALNQSSSTGDRSSFEFSSSLSNLSLWIFVGSSLVLSAGILLNRRNKCERDALNQQRRRPAPVIESVTEGFSPAAVGVENSVSVSNVNNDDAVHTIHIAAPR